MDTIMQDTLLFFDQHQTVYPLYEHFQKELFTRFPESRIKVQKAQISCLLEALLFTVIWFTFAPQCGQMSAVSLICLPHSRQVIIAM